jgi:hypothetical protein
MDTGPRREKRDKTKAWSAISIQNQHSAPAVDAKKFIVRSVVPVVPRGLPAPEMRPWPAVLAWGPARATVQSRCLTSQPEPTMGLPSERASDLRRTALGRE